MSKKLFTVNIREIYNQPGQMRNVQLAQELPETWGEGIARVAAGVTLELTVRLESVHEGILATCKAQTTMTGECARCLEEFAETLQVDFVELFAYNPNEADEYGVHGDHVNLEPPLRDAVVLALPFTPVCAAECPGLDPETGMRRDAGKAADAAAPVDPRWAALANFSVTKDS